MQEYEKYQFFVKMLKEKIKEGVGIKFKVINLEKTMLINIGIILNKNKTILETNTLVWTSLKREIVTHSII